MLKRKRSPKSDDTPKQETKRQRTEEGVVRIDNLSIAEEEAEEEGEEEDEKE